MHVGPGSIAAAAMHRPHAAMSSLRSDLITEALRASASPAKGIDREHGEFSLVGPRFNINCERAVLALPREMRLPALDRRQAVSASLLSLGVAPLSHWSAAAAASEAWPLIGLGTCCEEPAAAGAQVTSAVEAGFRLVDTAAHYPGESGVGDALSALEARGVVRPGEVQVCSKVWFDDMGYEPALSSARGSLARLRRERLDLLLIHFPGSPDARQDPKANRLRRAETWRALETLQADGYVRAIGLSNWTEA